MNKPVYADLGDYDEDVRIDTIGRVAMHHKKTAAFITDAEPPEKVERYIFKLKQRFPGIIIIAKWNGPTKESVIVKVGPPKDPAPDASP